MEENGNDDSSENIWNYVDDYWRHCDLSHHCFYDKTHSRDI